MRAAMRLAPLHKELDSFSPHGELRGNTGASRAMAARAVPPAATFEMAGKIRPPQGEEVSANQPKSLCRGTGNDIMLMWVNERRGSVGGEQSHAEAEHADAPQRP
jgi:hypothetical protein